MNHGAAWVVLEEYVSPHTRNLLSLLPSRKSAKDVRNHVEQLHVDRHCSIQTKISYKKSKKSVHVTNFFDPYSRIIHCGDDPIIIAIPAKEIYLQHGTLTFSYRIAVDRSDPFNPKFEDRIQTVVVETDA
jgi:hypothetical protein